MRLSNGGHSRPPHLTEADGNSNVPVRLIWGDNDWARSSERKHDCNLLAGAQMVTVEHGGHFLPLDRPDAVIEQIKTLVYGHL